MNTRKQEEIEFHDKLRVGLFDQRWSSEAEARLAHNVLWSNLKYYSIERKSVDFMRNWIKGNTPGKIVLDYGCGNGEESLFAARHGARELVGIDISPVAVENSAKRAAVEGLDGNARFVVTDGEALQFPDSYFDLAMEYGVLHHVDLNSAMRELSRVLKSDGQIICTETLGHNRAIRLYRKMTPHLRTEWETEHVLRREHFRIIARYFGTIEMHFFHLMTLGAVPFRKLSIFPYLLSGFELIDDLLLRLPFVKWQAWQTVFLLSKPRKSPLRA